MDLLLLFSWLILPAAAMSACALAWKIARIAATLRGLVRERRYFRHLIALQDRNHDEPSDYQDAARPVALALGFEYVDSYRAYHRSKRRLRLDLWRAADRETLALVSAERILWWTRHRTVFVSVLNDGARIATSDNFDEGDPLGLKGELIRRSLGFRDLYTLHCRRVQQGGRTAETIGQTNPLSVVEDLERSRVQQLAGAGLARYRGETQISWSYTLRGACDVYYRARPRQVREYSVHHAAQAKSAK